MKVIIMHYLKDERDGKLVVLALITMKTDLHASSNMSKT